MQARDILLFNSSDQSVNVSVYFQKGTFWLTQKTMAELFGVDRSVITKHLRNIFQTAELEENSVCAKIAHTAEDGKIYNTNFYRLEAILAVGYRVNSTQATAKNYLSHQHIAELNRIVSAYLDLTENNAQRRIAFNMQQWAKFWDSFLELSSYLILKDRGKTTMLEAKLKAQTEFDKFREIQDKIYESDFDKLVKKIKKEEK